MNIGWVEDTVLAVVQGLTTVFPISSSGHLVVIARLFGSPISLAAISRLHVGALLAVVVFYRRDLVALVVEAQHRRWLIGMGIAFAATVVEGLALSGAAVFVAARAELVAALWVANGAVLFLSAYLLPSASVTLGDLKPWQHAAIGAAQGLAVLPGVSRLGVTLVAAAAVGLAWRDALRYAFLVSIPTVLAANVFGLVTASAPDSRALLRPAGWDAAAARIGATLADSGIQDMLAILTAAVVGFLCLRFFNRLVGRRTLIYCGAYCVVTGLFSLVFLPLF